MGRRGCKGRARRQPGVGSVSHAAVNFVAVLRLGPRPRRRRALQHARPLAALAAALALAALALPRPRRPLQRLPRGAGVGAGGPVPLGGGAGPQGPHARNTRRSRLRPQLPLRHRRDCGRPHFVPRGDQRRGGCSFWFWQGRRRLHGQLPGKRGVGRSFAAARCVVVVGVVVAAPRKRFGRSCGGGQPDAPPRHARSVAARAPRGCLRNRAFRRSPNARRRPEGAQRAADGDRPRPRLRRAVGGSGRAWGFAGGLGRGHVRARVARRWRLSERPVPARRPRRERPRARRAGNCRPGRGGRGAGAHRPRARAARRLRVERGALFGGRGRSRSRNSCGR
jgi:hypothetical protein